MKVEVPLFQEVQYFHPLVYAIVGIVALVPVATGLPAASLVGLLVVTGITLLLLRMKTTVYTGYILIEFGWFHLIRFRISLSEVNSCQPTSYRPIRQFGGWGIRWGQWEGKKAWAYTTRGNKAVVLFTAKRTILLGTSRPELLSRVINTLLQKSGYCPDKAY